MHFFQEKKKDYRSQTSAENSDKTYEKTSRKNRGRKKDQKNNENKVIRGNEDDLNKALNENIIFGAGLDVFENEPIDKTNPLLSNKKVLLSPHSATFTNECKSRMSLETTKNIIDFFENKIDKTMIVKL